VVLNKNNLGIIAGSGLLPSTIADLHLKQGGQVYIAALEGETDVWYSQDFSPSLNAYFGTPFIPNIKFNTTFNVQI
jgi:DUF1009 family protein